MVDNLIFTIVESRLKILLTTLALHALFLHLMRQLILLSLHVTRALMERRVERVDQFVGQLVNVLIVVVLLDEGLL